MLEGGVARVYEASYEQIIARPDGNLYGMRRCFRTLSPPATNSASVATALVSFSRPRRLSGWLFLTPSIPTAHNK